MRMRKRFHKGLINFTTTLKAGNKMMNISPRAFYEFTRNS